MLLSCWPGPQCPLQPLVLLCCLHALALPQTPLCPLQQEPRCQGDCCRKLGSSAPHMCVYYGTGGSPGNAGSHREEGISWSWSRGVGGWAASGSDPISSLGDVASRGHKDAKGLTHQSHSIGRHLPGDTFQAKMQDISGAPLGTCRVLGTWCYSVWNPCLLGGLSCPESGPVSLGRWLKGSHVFFLPHIPSLFWSPNPPGPSHRAHMSPPHGHLGPLALQLTCPLGVSRTQRLSLICPQSWLSHPLLGSSGCV